MANVTIRDNAVGQIVGTVFTSGTVAALANGTVLGNGFDFSGHSLVGLAFQGTMVAGTMTFQVAIDDSGPYMDLKDSAGANVAIGPVSGQFAVSAVALAPLLAYNHVRVVFSSAQTNGGIVTFITKA